VRPIAGCDPTTGFHPAVRTDLTDEFAEHGISMISREKLIKLSFAALKAGKVEIRPGSSQQLAFLRRLAPDFIGRQLWKGSKEIPAAA
jgi:uncharacterized oxidoreductase